ncbi:Fe-S cluster assembly protein SufD [Conexibacter sp. SYSU D00693]|uniref:Fe-S cluster assembly protein SufD n=1 Tax=Conexibacter sp. SYSU D00693 TaxID=2812560 RepID=UPI00196AA44F|nr:Fe-S cluster assembly protein SufD [Conexibacter sp. SYSU D00693]
MATTDTPTAKGVEPGQELELPQFKGVPGWEFTPLDKLDLDAFEDAPGGSADAGAFPLGRPEGAVLVSSDAPSTEGPVVMPLAQAREQLPDVVEAHLGKVVTRHDTFTARNAARWTDGTLVYVPRNVHVEAPIALETVLEREGTALHHRTLVVLEEGAQAEVWDQVVGTDGLFNTVVELVVGPNANLRYVAAQDLDERAWIFGSQRAVIDRDAELDWTTLGFGSGNGKVFVETKLDGPGCTGKVTGAYATRGRQHLDFDTLQEHAAPNTVSDLAFRGIVSGRSSAVWRGMIQVDQGAQQTDAFQEARNLLLGKKAHADAIPGLEILADDVRCTHAAAIAQIDPEQVFYLRSRGVRREQAERLVVEGFLAALVERFAEGPVRDAVAAALERRLEQLLG